MRPTQPVFRYFRPVSLGAAALLLALAVGCTYSHGDPVPCDASAQTATYAAVISPIFDAQCRECHASNVAATLGGGTDFGDYLAIKNYPSANLLGSIEHAPGYDAMPKGRAKISECDIERIKAWMAAGELEN